jgi:hypothetical protein
MKNDRPFNVLDDVAKDFIPANTNLIPQVAARLERKSLMTKLRTRPFVAILIALLILLILSGTAYALGKVLGYIPGVGLISWDAPIRVLAEPVSLTRDGITVKVKEVILSSDKTVIRFTLDGTPINKVSQDITKCGIQWGGLILPDGSARQTIGGYGLDTWDSGYEARFTFDPVPPDVNQATFVPPCINHYLSGALPENWGLPLRFVPAPFDMKVDPVIEMTPSQSVSGENPMVLEKVIETEKGYILIGKFYTIGLPKYLKAVNFPTWAKITDANGQEVPYTFPDRELDLPLDAKEKGVFSWAFEFNGKTFNWPLTITSENLAVENQNAQAQFEFDTGPNPQEGQVWQDLKIDFKLAGHPVRVVSVIRTADSYQFSFESKSSTVFQGVELTVGNSTQGLTGMDSSSRFGSEVKFAGELPSGKLTVLVSRPIMDIPGLWQLKWMPDHATSYSSATPLAPTQSPQVCLTADTWKAALTNPAPIPAELNRKVIVSGLVIEDGKPPSAENMGIYLSRLDGSEKQVIGQGLLWASTSQDGTQVVFGREDGLQIQNLTTGETSLIPNTTADDIEPHWSPDGTRIAFTRYSEQGLYLVHSDGSSLQKISSDAKLKQLVGWWPDSSALLYGTPAQDDMALQKLDILSGKVSDLFLLKMYIDVSISPTGNEIAFADKVDQNAYGLYVSGRDGSNRKMVATMNDQWMVSNPNWSPDSQWLLVNILDVPTMNQDEPATALVNLQTCQIIPVPITGNIRSWVP